MLYSGGHQVSLWFLFGCFRTSQGQAGTDVGAASCVDRCDEEYFPGLPCYCNDACAQYENCCFDYYQECKPDFVWSEEWSEWNGHSYKYFNDLSITWQQAEEACHDHGAMLISINSQEEHEFMEYSVLKKRTLSAFIGGRKEDTVWTWLDMERMALPADPYHAWGEGQPENDEEKICTVTTNYKYWAIRRLVLGSYIWRAHSCRFNAAQEIQGYICERTLQCEPNPCHNNGTCQYVGGDEEFVCNCKDGFVGDRCEIEVREGELWTRCGETNLTQEVGVITSPLFPRPYPANVRCQWLITADEQQTIFLTLVKLDLEDAKDCVFDSLTVFDGSDTNSSTLLPPICGVIEDQDDDFQTQMTSSSGEVLVVFHTDKNEQRTGFQLTYEMLKCGLGTGDSGCGTGELFTSQCGSIEVDQGPVSTSCGWTITVQDNQIIQFSFHQFHIEETGMDCRSGGLAVYDGNDDSGPLLAVYCGERFPWTLYSRGNRVHFKLYDVSWTEGKHAVILDYEAISEDSVEFLSDFTKISGHFGSFTSRTSPINMRTREEDVYRWLVTVPVGDHVVLNYSLDGTADAQLQIHLGYSEESELVRKLNTSSIYNHILTDSLRLESFVALLVLRKPRGDIDLTLSVSFQAQEWQPVLSGCYRPYFYNKENKGGTENNVIVPMEPVMLMVSDEAFDENRPGYDAGLYCKWLLRGTDDERLSLRVLDALIKPHQEDCGYDGVVIYDGNTTSHPRYGPYCGSHDVITLDVTSSSNTLLVVFYSDRRSYYRHNGIFRAIVTTAGDVCTPRQMNTQAQTVADSCGVIMSPNFPGFVEPNLWTWTLQGPDKAYFKIYPYYVRGPGIAGDCDQYFQLVEVAHDSTQLIQYATPFLKLCGDTDLFIPPYNVKSPPHNKVMIELNTMRNSVPRKWQFKLYFEHGFMDPPVGLEDGTVCPEEYVAYRGYCYRYYSWVLRHYRPDDYRFQETWTRALLQCEAENATLVSIQSADEAYFIKMSRARVLAAVVVVGVFLDDFVQYMFGSPDHWLWDPAATHQINHRILYIGLHNRYNRYEWTDGTPIGYSDWYKPPPSWAQSTVYEDTLVTDLLYLKYPQPTADVGSLCTVMMLTSPFYSTNWAKIPCDYPIFRAGLICKQPGLSQTVDHTRTPSSEVLHLAESGSAVCPDTFIMVSGRCLKLERTMLFTNATYGENEADDNLEQIDRGMLCREGSWLVGDLNDQLFQKVKNKLEIWRHGLTEGDILLNVTEEQDVCSAIKVSKEHALDDVVRYELMRQQCDQVMQLNIRFALCEASAFLMRESCGQHEFTCNNSMCILVDNVCDGVNDCLDDSDETNCGCGMSEFRCDDGRCISISLYCDGQPNCGDESDEDHCVAESCNADQFSCDDGHCIDRHKLCDFKLDCQNGHDEEEEICSGMCRGFQCFSGRCLPDILHKDSISDCPGLSLEDELDVERDLLTMFDVYVKGLTQNDTYYESCEENDDYVQCERGRAKCYPRSQTCQYRTELVNGGRNISVQTSCRDGAHIRSHCEEADCAGMFHCPGGFCIPYSKLCDGSLDCPGGWDELNCDQYICPALFKCSGSRQCLSHAEVCDGTPQCLLHRDDEKYCGLIDPVCEVCSCRGYVAMCEGLNLTTLPYEFLSNSTRSLRSLNLERNLLTLTSSTLSNLHWLGRLNMASNELSELPDGLFTDLKNLFELNLSKNKLTTLQPSVFEGLESIRKIDLSKNLLRTLPKQTLQGINSVQHLIISENLMGTLQKNTFEDLVHMRELNTDAYKYCCIAKHVEVCTPEADEFSSCEDLMANYALQISIWVLGTCAFCGNLFVVIWRIKTDRQKVSSFFIINLGCSDFLMGVYMLVIASVDVHYRGRYSVHADAWRSSALCQFAGMMAMLSSEVSVFMLTAITCDRAMSILFPLKVGNVRMKHARMVAAAGWVICFILSVLPAMNIPYYGDAFFGRTGVCLPFQISNDKAPGWEYSVFIFLVINLISFIIIFIGYAAIFMRVKTSMKEMGAKSTASTNEYNLAKKLAIIVATDFLCWVPIILIGFAALGGASISPQVSAWVAVFILPMNSAVNPMLYTISAIDCGGRRKKSGRGAINSTITSGGRATKMTSMSVTNGASTNDIPTKQ